MDSLLLNATPSPEPSAANQQTPNSQPKLLNLPPDFVARRLSRNAPRLPPQTEQLPCPRCDSPNTKFCYYNNYNLSQPRHFCKSCRRYWTRGGALRNVPVGSGTRKSASAPNKRSRRTIAAAAKREETPVPSDGDDGAPGRAQPLDPDPEPGMASANCFWGNNEQMGSGDGVFPFNGYGVGPDFEQTGLDWPMAMEQVGRGDGGHVVVADVSAGCDTWQIDGDEADGGSVEGDFFTWADLAISTPAEALE